MKSIKSVYNFNANSDYMTNNNSFNNYVTDVSHNFKKRDIGDIGGFKVKRIHNKKLLTDNNKNMRNNRRNDALNRRKNIILYPYNDNNNNINQEINFTYNNTSNNIDNDNYSNNNFNYNYNANNLTKYSDFKKNKLRNIMMPIRKNRYYYEQNPYIDNNSYSYNYNYNNYFDNNNHNFIDNVHRNNFNENEIYTKNNNNNIVDNFLYNYCVNRYCE